MPATVWSLHVAADRVAQRFDQVLRDIGPRYGFTVAHRPWAAMPPDERGLLCAVFRELLRDNTITAPDPQAGDTHD